VVVPELPRDPARAIAAARSAVVPGSVLVGHSMGGVLALSLAMDCEPRAVVLTGSFFPPARNGRSLGASLRDYGAHRVAFLRSMERRGGGESSARALLSLVRRAARPGGFGAGVSAPVLVVHAVDDHHVPVDFAVAAARSRDWDLRVLPAGGHHAHVVTPAAWLEAVVPWLRREPSARPPHTPRG
jgi:pimeloyl-ACP methyl ester carboxylesterase